MQNKLISLRFAESTDPVASEAIGILKGISGSYDKIWLGRTKMVAEWYKCWLEVQQRQYKGVAGETN